MVRIDFMRTFVEVVKAGSLKKAARNLGLSVSTVSFQINALESLYGAELLRRSVNGVKLTEEGKIALKNIEAILNSIEDTKKLIANLKGEKVVIASGMVGLNVIHALQVILKSQYPQLEVKFELHGAHECVRGVLSGKYDFAIAGDLLEEHMNDPRLVISEVGEDRLVLILPKDHPLAGKGKVELEEVKREPLIMLTDDYGITTSTKKALEASGVRLEELNVAHIVSDYYSKLNAVSSGMGVAITSHLAACKACEVGMIKIRPIEGFADERKIYIIASRLAMESSKMREYAEFIISKSRQLFAEFAKSCRCFD
ncbi:MAG: LysR family transcriptional regulator [Archaeoglobaceae archaeon]